MKFTRIFSIIFLALLSIQFNLNCCSDENGDSLTAPENSGFIWRIGRMHNRFDCAAQ